MPSDAQKIASKLWDTHNTKVIGAKVKTDVAEKFREYCASQGKKPNAVIKEYVMECIEKFSSLSDEGDS